MIVNYKNKIYRVQFESDEPVMVEVIYRVRVHWYGYRSGRRRTQIKRRIWARTKEPSRVAKAVIEKALDAL